MGITLTQGLGRQHVLLGRLAARLLWVAEEVIESLVAAEVG